MSKQDLIKIIKSWVEKSYGKSETNNPSWSIEGLANEILLKGKVYR
jgi:hypothetical protein